MPVTDEDLAPSVPANMRANDEPTKQMVKDEKEASLAVEVVGEAENEAFEAPAEEGAAEASVEAKEGMAEELVVTAAGEKEEEEEEEEEEEAPVVDEQKVEADVPASPAQSGRSLASLPKTCLSRIAAFVPPGT